MLSNCNDSGANSVPTGTSRTNAPRANFDSGTASMSPEEYMRDQLAKQPGVYAGITEESVYRSGPAIIKVTPPTKSSEEYVRAKLPNISDTLAERGGRYGKFIDHSKISQGLQDAMRAAENWDKLDVDMRQALTTIADKMARILNGDPYYADSWHDIQGYSRLVETRLLEMNQQK